MLPRPILLTIASVTSLIISPACLAIIVARGTRSLLRRSARNVAQTLLCRPAMLDDDHFRHMGGGRKGAFLILRYLFIAAASHLPL